MKKKIFLVLAVIMLVSIALVGCEKSTQIRTAYISEITSAGSKNYGVKVGYGDDKRLDGKGTDVQVKFSETGKITIWQDGQDKIEYEIKDYDEWYSMTEIFSDAKSETKGKAKIEKYEDVLNKTYLFNHKGKIKVTLRVVMGDIIKDSEGDGEILIGSQPISDNFTLKIK